MVSTSPGRILPPAAVVTAVALLASGCATAALAPAVAPGSGGPVAVSRHFAFHSDFWVNLHHVLYFQAASEAAASGERHRLGVGPDLSAVAALPAGDREAWRRAVDLYRRELIARDLLFDNGMVELRDALADRGPSVLGGPGPDGAPALEVPPELPDALRAAAAVYRRHLWPEHDRRNRAWVEATLPWLERYEARMARDLARAWGSAFPAEPFRTDVSIYGHWSGAYTTRDPDRVTISSVDPDHAAAGAVESLFHEVSHSAALGAGLPGLVASAFEGTGERPSRDFSHVLIFHTAGHLAREAFAADGSPEYELYALRLDLLERIGAWAPIWRALDVHWLPYLRGESGREAALAAAARAAATAGSEPPGR